MPEVDPILVGNDRLAAAEYVRKHSNLVNKVSDGKFNVRIDGQNLPVNPDRVDYRDPNNSPRAGTLSELQQGLRDAPRSQGSATAGEETPAFLTTPRAPEAPSQPQQQPRPWPGGGVRETPRPQQEPAQQPQAAPAQPAQPQLVELEVDGSPVQLPREVAAKLVAQGQQVERAQELLRRAQAVRDDTTLDVLASGAYRQASPEQRREFVEWMRKVGGGQAAPQPQGLDEAGEPAMAPQAAPQVPGLAEMQRNLQLLTHDLQERRAHEARMSARQWMARQIDEVPVFKENEALKRFAHRDLEQAIAQNPQADPARLVATVATHYTQIAAASRQQPAHAAASQPASAMQGRGQPAPLAPAVTPSSDRPTLTGKDLLNRRIGAHVRRFLNSQP